MQLRTLIALMASLVPTISAGEVFAHYMAGDILASSAETDVNAAKALGFSAFAINLNADALSSNWAERCTDRLFSAAAKANFKCFISMDLNNADDNTRNRFKNYVNKYMAHSAYYKRDKRPLLSTFSVGRTSPSSWPNFLKGLNNGNGVYFIPEPDNAEGYYAYGQPAGAAGFWNAWAPVVDGVFSWETAWTKDGKNNVSVSDWDEPHAAEAHKRGLSYMVPMSSLQYKHWVDGSRNDNWYRVGEVNLPERMTQVLAMDPKPDMAEVITWNDSGESHYIGTVHTDGQIPAFAEYANEQTYSHVAWQPLFRSFIKAFADGKDARGMRPVQGKDYEGALWYRSVLTNANCRDKPSGASDAKDALNWAVVVAGGKTNAYIQAYSNGVQILSRTKLSPGLNYGSIPGLRTGKPYIEVVEIDDSGTWNYKYTKTGDVSVSSSGGLCNYNYLVYGLEAGRYN
ncbi:glycosyl hydrolase family 71 domain-containing protein [Sarocladium implicatum]|nr:glycosyl hydrolase family 71 domain-containing protein [Sarocladium implicatum]